MLVGLALKNAKLAWHRPQATGAPLLILNLAP